MRFGAVPRLAVSFRDPDGVSTRFREFTFADVDKISAPVDWTGMRLILEDHQGLELGLRSGAGQDIEIRGLLDRH
jgi:hypothetical protein